MFVILQSFVGSLRMFGNKARKVQYITSGQSVYSSVIWFMVGYIHCIFLSEFFGQMSAICPKTTIFFALQGTWQPNSPKF